MTWFSIYVASIVMMFPVVAIVVFLIHDGWKSIKEADHDKWR